MLVAETCEQDATGNYRVIFPTNDRLNAVDSKMPRAIMHAGVNERYITGTLARQLAAAGLVRTPRHIQQAIANHLPDLRHPLVVICHCIMNVSELTSPAGFVLCAAAD